LEGTVNSVFNASFRALSLTIGLLLLYAAFFLYEDEERKLQNSIEDIWKKVRETSGTALTRAAVSFQEIAKLFIRGIDRVFGVRVFSLQFFAVSFLMAVTSGDILFFNSLTQRPVPDVLQLLLAMLPAIFRRKWAVWVAGLPLFAFVAFMVYASISTPGFIAHPSPGSGGDWDVGGAVILLGGAAAITSAALLVALERAALRWAANRPNMTAVAALVLLNGALLALLIGPLYFWRHSPTQLFQNGIPALVLMVVVAMSFCNLCPAIIAALMCLTSGVMVLHRIFWPVLARPLFAVARLVRKPPVLAAPGMFFVSVGLYHPHWFGTIREFFGL
jgi:hypothetical protein